MPLKGAVRPGEVGVLLSAERESAPGGDKSDDKYPYLDRGDATEGSVEWVPVPGRDKYGGDLPYLDWLKRAAGHSGVPRGTRGTYSFPASPPWGPPRGGGRDSGRFGFRPPRQARRPQVRWFRQAQPPRSDRLGDRRKVFESN